MMKMTVMNKFFAVLSLLAGTALLSSCTVVKESHTAPEQLESTLQILCKNMEKMPEVAKGEKNTRKTQLMEGYLHSRKLLKAFIKNDGNSFVNLLPAQLRKEFDHKKFDVTRKAVISSMGEPVSFRYVTALEMTAVTPHIWAIRFSRISRDEKEEYFSEMLFRVITGHLDGKPYIIGFNFF